MADLSRVISWIEGEIRKADSARDAVKKEKKYHELQAADSQAQLEEAEKLVLILELARDKIKDTAS